jgi:2-dehydro-3-deoxyphosphogluconate aldolase/(4S)-4-hydroxy-2-oxoglutarate aldolase
MTAQFLAGLSRARLLAIIRGDDAESSIAAALTLFEEGFRYLEISLNTHDALGVIARVAREAPEGAFVGAGTVLTTDDVARVCDAGAVFAVTPAVAESVAECSRLGLPVIAGALTPTEVVAAMRQGATAVKLFPASVGGPSYLKALRDPLPNVPFIAVGGVDVGKVEEYLAVGAAAVGLGSPLLGDAPSGGDLGALRERARAFHEAVAPWLDA